MATSAIFPTVPMRSGMYESFYLRAVARDEPLGAWIRHTVHKRPGQRPRGSVWCTVFDGRRGRPFMHKLTSDVVRVPRGGWIAVGDCGNPRDADPLDIEEPTGDRSDPGESRGQGAILSGELARGSCGPARWSLRFAGEERELRHLPRAWLYRAPLPRTKLTSPKPAARFDGLLELASQDGAARGPIELHGWRGMIGHNWGSEHAERWIWLHGIDFEQAPDVWLDLAIGRVKVAGRLTPWVANGVLSLDRRRWRLGGLTGRGLQATESAEGCSLRLAGERGLSLEAEVQVPPQSAAGWSYADPDPASRHDVVNCSIAALALTVRLPHERAPRTLSTAHGCAYELGMREHDHGVPLAPFPDG